jgi:Family of unknown function (DUF6526)
MAEPTQTYKNHARLVPAYHYFVLPVLLLHVVNQIRHLWLAPSLATVWTLIVALALLTLAFYARVMALKVQDRVIRLEMRMRLAGVLPPDLRSRINDLTPSQLVALRFACDAELPGLVREVLDGQLKTTKEIKLRVKDWQADWLRA